MCVCVLFFGKAFRVTVFFFNRRISSYTSELVSLLLLLLLLLFLDGLVVIDVIQSGNTVLIRMAVTHVLAAIPGER